MTLCLWSLLIVMLSTLPNINGEFWGNIDNGLQIINDDEVQPINNSTTWLNAFSSDSYQSATDKYNVRLKMSGSQWFVGVIGTTNIQYNVAEPMSDVALSNSIGYWNIDGSISDDTNGIQANATEYTDGDIINIELDFSRLEVSFYKNDIYQASVAINPSTAYSFGVSINFQNSIQYIFWGHIDSGLRLINGNEVKGLSSSYTGWHNAFSSSSYKVGIVEARFVMHGHQSAMGVIPTNNIDQENGYGMGSSHLVGSVGYFHYDGKISDTTNNREAQGTKFVDGDIITIILDFNQHKVSFLKNGTYQGEVAIGNGPYSFGVSVNYQYSIQYIPDPPVILTPMPTTSMPTNNPITAIPTINPTTSEPSNNPTTSEPSQNPTTSEPSQHPTTSMPTTSMPTTSIPTTSMPTTSMPTTSMPTTTDSTMTHPNVDTCGRWQMFFQCIVITIMMIYVF